MRAQAAATVAEHQAFLDKLVRLPDLQCAWILLSMCAAARSSNLLRTLPPSVAAPYAEAHDDAVWSALLTLLGHNFVDGQIEQRTRWISQMPKSLGGLGLQSAGR
eukprot:9114530-Karenia_brevis.AAC.1